MFKVIKKEGKARRGVFTCAHGGEVQTPVFMNVGTQAAIKGGVSAVDLKERLGTWCGKWEDFISSCAGMAPSSPTAVAFRCSLWQGCERSRRRA